MFIYFIMLHCNKLVYRVKVAHLTLYQRFDSQRINVLDIVMILSNESPI